MAPHPQGRVPLVLLPGEANRIGAPDGAHVLQLASAELTEGSLMLVETVGTTVGSGPPMHVHHRDDEAFFITAGSYRMHVAGQDHVCPAGSFIYLPRGTVHGFYALEPGSRKLNIYTPASHAGFYEELDDVLANGRDDAQLVDLFERYHTEIVGPIPGTYR